MPELPDVVVYCEAVAARVRDEPLVRVELLNPFVLRTAVPPITQAEGRRVLDVRRLGKRIVLSLEGDLHLVVHLMIAGRLRWLAPGAPLPGRISLAVLHFPAGRLVLTEAGSKRRASLHLVEGEHGLDQFRMGGLEILDIDADRFATRLTSENHTLKRALTDPRLFSGVGNAYSDEILHRARLSPIAHTQKLKPEQIAALYHAAREVLTEWTVRLREQSAGAFPEKVTAFRPEMAVHGRYGEPCPVCGSPVQRIVYAENECNYCARCQTGGTLLADRALSRLLHKSWPRKQDPT
ncbi:MAG TPA: DNA-formamidopyrimidine glycosylase family protein [Casimicrobiaceae bacterium]